MSVARTPKTAATALRIDSLNADCYGQVKQRLRGLIDDLAAAGTLRLPSEAELSVALGVSRATLRSALQSLQKEGRIRRLHGLGTFINRHAVGLRNNLAEGGATVDLLAAAGYRPSVRTLDRRVEPLGEADAASLEAAPGDGVLRIERVILADDVPAVHSVDLFPTRLLPAEPLVLDEMRSTFEFVTAHLGAPVAYSVAELHPVLPPAAVAAALRLRDPVTPLLRLRHIHVQADERPVAVNVIHVNDALQSFSLIRTYRDE